LESRRCCERAARLGHGHCITQGQVQQCAAQSSHGSRGFSIASAAAAVGRSASHSIQLRLTHAGCDERMRLDNPELGRDTCHHHERYKHDPTAVCLLLPLIRAVPFLAQLRIYSICCSRGIVKAMQASTLGDARYTLPRMILLWTQWKTSRERRTEWSFGHGSDEDTASEVSTEHKHRQHLFRRHRDRPMYLRRCWSQYIHNHSCDEAEACMYPHFPSRTFPSSKLWRRRAQTR
jgi:hypothetical protein